LFALPQEATVPEPPSSVFSIPASSSVAGKAGVVIRDVGCTRRVFLTNPHLSTDEIEGLAYRIKMLTRSTALNSVLIASTNDDDEANGALPSSMTEFDDLYSQDDDRIDDFVFLVAGGYDALELHKSGRYKDEAHVQRLLDALGDLAIATRGHPDTTRIPVITLPHGLVHDGGYALCMGGFVLATPDTCFKVLNPSKGLSFDPVGLSFVLPRLGWEFKQVSAEYTGCGLILALTGMEANVCDMMETGLATHFVDNVNLVPMLERALGEMPSWEQQGLMPRPKRFYGADDNLGDYNAQYRNIGVGNLIHAFCEFNAEGVDLYDGEEEFFHKGDDPSVDLDYKSLIVRRESDLVNYAATFDDVFRKEKSVEGIMERLRQIGERQSSDPEEMEGIAVANDLFERMRRQSPLALRVIYALMERGGKRFETLESCIKREKRAQLNLLRHADFDNWAHAQADASHNGQPFTGWMYKTAGEVPQDQVEEILGR
jgi:enoyl-CoA hydratase/carnithine racemase